MNDRREPDNSETAVGAALDPSWAGLHYLIEQSADQRAGSAALRFGNETLSYAELNGRANQCAHYLRDLGVGPDVLVGVLMERSVELVIGLLAILKAGGAYLPLAPDYPAERLKYILKDTGLSIVMTRSDSAPLLEGLDATVLSLDTEWKWLASLPDRNPLAMSGPRHLAYVIYTSGSTGQPKGCMIEHASICNRLLWMRDHYGITESDRILQKTPYTFDVSVWEFFLPLISGACLVLAKPGGHKDNRYLTEIIQAEGITVCHFVPSMLRYFLRQDGTSQCRSLRHLFASGEALAYELMSQCLRILPARLHNLYGPTEAAVDVTYWECAERSDKKTPIGRPIAHTTLYILDENLQPVAPGEAGELFIGGIGVGRGYYNRPELTRERFVRDPFSSETGTRLYRTGDKVRMLADGQIEYLGRLDLQVKLRGFRIELGEIEQTLRGHEAIEDAAVLVRDGDSEDPKLVAYLVIKGRPISVKEVRDFVKRKLPEYMAPNQVVILNAFPTNGHGKLDRSALPWPAPGVVAGVEEETRKPETNAVETPADSPHAAELVFTRLADAEVTADLQFFFKQALGVSALEETADLFDLGATSFTMVQAVDYIQTQYGVVVPLETFLDSPTLRAIAADVKERAAKPSGAAPRDGGKGTCVGASRSCQPSPPPVIPLEAVQFKEEAWAQGQPVGRFSGRPVPAGSLGRLLSPLRRHPQRAGPKHLYSSAGGLRSVQAYLFIREHGVEGVFPGYYYYHPEEHRLYPLGSAPRIEEAVFCPYHRPAFSKAGFVLFLIAQMDAIQPIYRNTSPVLVAVEAGYMAQALMSGSAAPGLRLCPVAGIDFEAIREGFQLEPTHQFLHCLLGGMASGQTAPGEGGGGLADFLKANGLSVQAHGSDDAGDKSFSHFLRAEDLGEGLPTLEEKDQHHRRKRHLRRFEEGAKAVDLRAWEAEAGYYLLRSAKRSFRDGPVAFGRFSRFMALVSAEMREGMARYLYPSIIGTHPLKVFVYIKPGGVEGVAEGLYRYDTIRRQLEMVTSVLSVDLKTCHTPFNRANYLPSKFCLFLVGPTAGLKPSFGEDSAYYAFLESGYLGQLLLDRQAEFGLGVCPIGGMRYEKIRDDFKLEPGDIFLHSFVAGEVTPECPIPWEPLEAGKGSRLWSAEMAVEQTGPNPTQAGEAIAVVGISGRFPGAENLPALARVLREGKSCFREMRYDRPENYRGGAEPLPGRPAARHWGGFLEEVDCFDSLLFQISPAEARALDPQERLLLEVAWECLESSGYTGAEMSRVAPRVGVFVGAMWDDYQHYHPGGPVARADGQAISAHHSSIANRLSFFFDFKGPSVAVNTSCSSALTALHFACQSLLAGECQAALAGGVNLMAHPYHHEVLSASELLSEDEVCRPFGLMANGWVAGEGAGAVLLKPLRDAIRDRDTIHGVILGTAISHSGRTGRYGAPNSKRQAESMRQALEKAGLKAEAISYVEAAAPGAGMADAAEAAALKEVFGASGTPGLVVHVGSIKANIGHLESASAMSQLAKVLLQMKHGQIFPTLQSQPANPLVQWQNTVLKIPEAVTPWLRDNQVNPRRALINAFGATGSGGHIVVEEYVAPERPDGEAETLIVLSAATHGQLASAAGRLREFLDQPDSAAARISDIGYTLRVGRVAMKSRLALVVHSRRELRERLETFLSGSETAPGLYLGEAQGAAQSERRILDLDLHQVAEQWVTGACVLGSGKDDDQARRIPLPTYPFAKARHWVGGRSEERCPQPEQASGSRRLAIEVYLKELFARVTEIPRDQIEARATFDAFGITSLMVKRLNALLGEDFGELSSALLFERQTIESLADYFLANHPDRLRSLFAKTPSPWAAEAPLPASIPCQAAQTKSACVSAGERRERPIAIVGMSGKYPQAANLAEFWENLKNGVDCITGIPAGRWEDAKLQAVAGPHSRWGGFIDGVDEFDPLFFKISPREAIEMDPQERLFLQTVWHLFEDAGWAPSNLGRALRDRMGVFVGVMYGEYQLHSGWDAKEQGGIPVTSLYGSIANRVSYYFDFHGPSMAVDTLCSSSLTALHLAMQSLQSGECEAAVVGGVNLSIHPNKYLLQARLTMSSSDGRCRSFGQGGDGFVPGEGVGAILLKPLEQALRDGDTIYGIVRATVINHDGKTHGYTVPNPNAQAAMIAQAIRQAGVEARFISYVEAHGTGTALGDPIEISGLTQAFGQFTSDRQFCAIGSVKSNIGHLESAAGLAGLTKILLQMRHRKLVPSLHSEELNSAIRFEQTPFFVPQTLADWEPPRVHKDGVTRTGPRLACLSSFGAGGSNAHAILEEYPPMAEPSAAVNEPQLVVLSAKDADRLREVEAQLLGFVRKNPGCRLDELAYTLQAGREAMEERLAFAARSLENVAETIEAILDGRESAVPVFRGTRDRKNAALPSLLEDEDLQETIRAWIEKRKYDRIAKAWVEGAKVDWRRMHGSAAPRKVSLPPYPFARERYWVAKPAGAPDTPSAPASRLHPLLHRNSSDLDGLRFSSTFDGNEFFLNDHRLRGERVLPAAACLELARAAVELAAAGRAGLIELKNVVWAQPFAVSRLGRSIHANLRAEEGDGVRFEVYTNGPADSRMIISQGSAVFRSPMPGPRVDLKEVRERLQRADLNERRESRESSKSLTPAQCYEFFRSFGLEHGATFTCLQEMYRDTEAVLARLVLPPSVADTRTSFMLHPVLLDGLFQATVALGGTGSAFQPAIPYALDELICYQSCQEEMWAWVRSSGSTGTRLDLDLCDASGAVCVRIKGFSTRAMEADSAPAARLFEPVWREVTPVGKHPAPSWKRHWVVLCGFDPAVAHDLAAGLPEATCVPLQPGTGDPASRFEAAAIQIFEILKQALTEKPLGNALLQVLVSSAAEDHFHRGLLGLLQTAHQENPAITGQLIEVDVHQGTQAILQKLAENRLRPEDTHIRYATGRRRVAAWEPLAGVESLGKMPWKQGGVYLVTGGAGGLGLLFAREIIRQTESCVLVLAGRSALAPQRENRLRALERPGVEVHYRQVDVTDSAAARALVQDCLRQHGSLNGILHAAGVIRDNYILKKTPDEMRQVLAPKVRGTYHLDEATRDLDLDFFICFSSTAGALGNAGQADYAAANGFLDAFAHYRNALARDGQRRGQALSINWPFWKEGGMKVEPGILAEMGVRPLESSVGLTALARAYASGLSQIMVEPGRRGPGRAAFPCPEPCDESRPGRSVVVSLPSGGLLPEKALRFFRTLLASTIQCPVERVQVDEPLDSYGIDSVMVMQMTNELEKSFGSLSKTLFFEHHTIRSLSGYFLETRGEVLGRLLGDPPKAAASGREGNPANGSDGMLLRSEASAEEESRKNRQDGLLDREVEEPGGQCRTGSADRVGELPEALDIAIIGLAGRYPQAADLEAFWNNLSQGKDCITEIPASRWDWKPYYDPTKSRPGAHFSKWGGFMDGVDAFDPLFFNISPREARYMDPQERLFLETCWAALEDAGYRPRELRAHPGSTLATQVGVYAGVMYSEYQLFAHEETLAGHPTVVGNIYASIANRVSYFLDLHGPSLTIDTMCSSSLTCIQLACLDLKNHLTGLALAGGVNVNLHPNKYQLLSAGQFISVQGRCGSFGREGDGYVPGEGVGVVVLKRLAEAVRDGDHIYGVIKGSAVNHGGKTNGFTVPNPEAQGAVIARALEVARIDPARISYVEAHSTGTPLGDPIEIAGLAKAFKTSPAEEPRCFLGSVKSNIGHCEAAAGIAGLTKVLLQMKHGQLAPSLHSEALNPHLELERTPFRVNQVLCGWERQVAAGRPLPYVAGISAFGAGGSNAHLVVEEFVEPPKPFQGLPDQSGPCAIILSARNEKRLMEMAGRLHQFIAVSPSLSLADIAYTLQVGRQPMEERLGFTASSIQELLELLEKAARGVANPGIRRGRVADGPAETLRILAEDDDINLSAALERWAHGGKLDRLIDLWVGGLEVDWRMLYRTARPRRISLPAYPFARDRYWLPRSGSKPFIPMADQNSPEETVASVPENGDWLAVREDWTIEPWPESLDWPARLRAFAGRRVALLVAEESEGREISRLIRQWEETAGLTAGAKLEVVRRRDLDHWRVNPPPEAILIPAPYGGSPEEDQRHVSALFHLIQKLMREAWNAPIRIYHLHDRSETQPRLRLEALGGLVRSAMLENQHHHWTCVMVEGEAGAEACRQTLLKEWLADEAAGQFSWIRHQGRERRRYRLVELTAPGGDGPVFRPKGTYLVAGGLGPIGEQLCLELASRYQARLILFSRGALEERKREQCGRLESLGARVSYYQVDITDRTALAAAWEKMKRETGKIHGVIHLARSVEDDLLLSKSWESFERVVRAKVNGTQNLDDLTAAEPLDFFLLFSSMAAFGIRGSADYGYSSAFQNAFAGYRNRLSASGARFGKTLACGWGPWKVDTYQPENRNTRLRDAGLDLIDMARAFPWIERRCWRNEPFLGLMLTLNRDKVRADLGLENYPTGALAVSSAVQERIEEWEHRKRSGEPITASEISRVLRSDQVVHLGDALTSRLHALLAGSGNGNGRSSRASHEANQESGVDLVEDIKRSLAELLELEEVEDTRPFPDYGMDSISGMRFCLLLEKKFKLPVPPQWLMEHPTARALAGRLAEAKKSNRPVREE